MRSHKHFHSSSSQFLHPSSAFVHDQPIYDSLRSNKNYDNTYRAASPYGKSMSRSIYSTANLAKSSNNLNTLDKKANADPELKGVRKSKKGYHLYVDLKAHLLHGMQRADSSMQRSNVLSSEQRSNVLSSEQRYTQNSLRNGYNHSVGDISRLNGGSRVSMMNLTDITHFPVPPPIINRPKTYSSNQRTVIDLEGTKNNNLPTTTKPTNYLGDGYIMKSLKASEPKKAESPLPESNKENIEFDLCLFGTVNKHVKKVISEPKQRPTIIQKETESRGNRREVMEEEVTHRTNVGIPSFNIRPPKTTRRVVEEKISKGIIDNLNNVTYDLEEEEQVLLERLMRGAPQGSFQKEINVERETEEIFGPLPEEEVEKLYAKEMINVDVISEMVHLELNNGMADVQLKLTFNKIVPVKGSKDTFKMTKVVVNKNIVVDLTATAERRKICDEVLRVQKNGILDKEYTWMLYRIFSTLADNQNEVGISEGRVRIDKEVGEERVYNLNREMNNARGNTDKKFQILEETFLGPDERSDYSRPNSSHDRNDLSRSTSGWSYQDTQRPSFVQPMERNLYNGGHNNFSYNGYKPKQEKIEAHDYFLESNTQRFSKRIDEASNNLTRPRDTSWKNNYSRWLSSDKESTGSSRNHRMDVFSYLRPGGSRNYNYLIEDNSYQKHNSTNPILSQEESISDKVLNQNGLNRGAHNERMRSYERGVERNDEDLSRMKSSQYAGTRSSRKDNYTRGMRY